MITSIPSDPYDPDLPEDNNGKSRFVSAKDLVIIGIVIAVLVGIFTPLILDGIERKTKVVCFQNMKAIGEAMLLYSSDNNDRMPPTHNMDFDGSPSLVSGLPVTWASQTQPLMSVRQDFICPNSKPEELVQTVSLKPGERSFNSSYGMYRGISSVLRSDIPNPNEVVAVAETSNSGSRGSFNPIPFEAKPDGFLIGWDNSNFEFTKETKSVTRLSFFGTGAQSHGRHKSIVHAISADGNLIPLAREDSETLHSGNKLKGRWWADTNLYR